MQPVFEEYAHFLHGNGCDISWLQERIYWLDHNIVKAFTGGGQRLISLYKIAVSDDLTVALTKHKQNVGGLQFESWDETIARFRPHLESIKRDSIAFLRQYGIGTERKIINTNSTGKDSMVVVHLAKKAGLNFETYLNVTILDVVESNRMARRNGFRYILPNPEHGGFYKYIQRYDGGG